MLLDIANCPEDKLEEVACALEDFKGEPFVVDLLNVTLQHTSPWRQLDVPFLLTQIWCKLERWDKAKECFARFLSKRQDDNQYYGAVDTYLRLRADGLEESQAEARMRAEADDASATEQAIADLSNPAEVFRFTKLPTCPNCDSCALRGECLTVGKMTLARTLYPIMQRNGLDQMKSISTIGLRA